jgi:hypothetical protein
MRSYQEETEAKVSIEDSKQEKNGVLWNKEEWGELWASSSLKPSKALEFSLFLIYIFLKSGYQVLF